MKLEINHRKGNEKKLTTLRLNSMLVKNQWINEKIKKEIRGVPIVAQWLTSPTSIREDVLSIPGLAQWVKGSGVA